MALWLIAGLILWPGHAAIASPVSGGAPWRPLQPGVEYARFPFPNPSGIGESRLHVVRIDPRRAALEPVLASERGGQRRTAGEWCRMGRLAVAINAGMFQSDGSSNVGYLRSGKRLNNPRWNDYRAVLCIGPRRNGDPPIRWLDRDDGAHNAPSADRYDVVIQNLRLIRSPGRNCWGASAKRWSEAAIARDGAGRLLFLFARCPLSMDEFNRALLKLPLEVVQAMHVEGGPEASLSIHAAGVDLDLCGSYETGFHEDDSNAEQWPLPNVLGVKLVP